VEITGVPRVPIGKKMKAGPKDFSSALYRAWDQAKSLTLNIPRKRDFRLATEEGT
jgi:hypothetical protein